MDLLRLDAASTTWSDYVGTAAADDADVLAGSPSLYNLADLDRDRWVIVAVDLAVQDREPDVVVYALDRIASAGSAAHFDIEQVIATHGHVPLTAFRLASGVQVETFLSDAFKRVAIRLVARGFRDETLVVRR